MWQSCGWCTGLAVVRLFCSIGSIGICRERHSVIFQIMRQPQA